MSIRFKDKNEGTPTKEEMKLHIIENLIENRFKISITPKSEAHNAMIVPAMSALVINGYEKI